MPAPAAKEQEAENGNVVVPGDRGLARWTKRSRPYNGQIAWDPKNTDIQEAADHQAEQGR